MARGSQPGSTNPKSTGQTPANPPTQPANPKDNNDNPKETPEPQEETKENAKKMGWKGIGSRILKMATSDFGYKGPEANHFNLLNLFSQKESNENDGTEKKTNLTPKELLGQIYKALVKLDTYRKLQYQESRNHLTEQNLEKNIKNKEIIKALLGLVRKSEEPKEEPKPEPKEEPKKEDGKGETEPNKNSNTSTTPAQLPEKSIEVPKSAPKVEPKPEPKPAPKVEPKPVPKVELKPEPKTETKPEPKPEPIKSKTAVPENQPPSFSPIIQRITSPIGNRMKNGKLEYHKGMDFAVTTGTKLYSAGDGKVMNVGEDKGRGKYIDIKLDNGNVVSYFHLSDNTSSVKRGEKVVKGTLIGLSGSTGESTGPHLHLQMRDENQKLITSIPKDIQESVFNPKQTATEETKTTPVSTATPTSSSKPEFIPNSVIQLEDGDPGYTGTIMNFVTKNIFSTNANKLQRDYQGYWYYEDGTLVRDREKINSAEKKWKLKTYGVSSKVSSTLQNNSGTTIDKSSSDNKTYKEEFFATSNDSSSSQTTIIMNKKVNNKQYAKVDDTNPYVQKQG